MLPCCHRGLGVNVLVTATAWTPQYHLPPHQTAVTGTSSQLLVANCSLQLFREHGARRITSCYRYFKRAAPTGESWN